MVEKSYNKERFAHGGLLEKNVQSDTFATYFIPRLDHNKSLDMEIERLEYRNMNLMEIV